MSALIDTQENSDSLLSSIVVASAPSSLSKTTTNAFMNKTTMLECLIDTGSSDSFISAEIVRKNRINVIPTAKGSVSLAAGNCETKVLGTCNVELEILGHHYKSLGLKVLKSLCTDLILGVDVMSQHEAVEFNFGGSQPKIVIEKTQSVTCLTTVNREPPRLFGHLDPECKPIKAGSRRYSEEDQKFISCEVKKLIDKGICIPSSSPWRAQVIVAKDETSNKRRLCIDYSQTINRFTHQDAYPLPNIKEQASAISKYKYYSHLDLTSAYHQIPIREDEQIFTAFEACGNLYQFTRVPFGVTNGPPCFQREVDDAIRENELVGTFAYIDNITIGGTTKEEHDTNLHRFMKVAKMNNFTFNQEKSVICKEVIDILGYRISHNSLQPDPVRLKPLKELPPPTDAKTHKRVLGLFAYYANWIPHYSKKIQPLLQVSSFPLKEEALGSFQELKRELEDATLQTIDENIPFVVETDASDFAIAAILNQGGRPVAFFSRSLKRSEKSHPAIEKEACSIVEALRGWKHYLCGKHFTLYTDQEAVSYIFNSKKLTKIKNDKLMRWRCELSCFDFEIIHRPGKENVAADAMSRVVSASLTVKEFDKLKKIHADLSHPGVTRMVHLVRSKNLPYSTEDVRSMVANCKVCCMVKPRYYKDPKDKHLIKATHPFERLNIDFKGPLPKGPQSSKRYILNIVDEYSRFPFAFACEDMKSSTVKSCLFQLFALFGMPQYIHSDRGQSFMSDELKEFLHSCSIATSRTTPYNPQGNGQVERYNSTLWKAIQLQLAERELAPNYWEDFLPAALHSIRSLLCTATNVTPHERLFNYIRKTATGSTLPAWLTKPGPVLLRKHVRLSKYDSPVEEVQLLDANHNYAHVKLNTGVEKTVSLRDLAPTGGSIKKTPVLCIKKSPMNPVQVVTPAESSSPDFDESDSSEAEPAPIRVTSSGREIKLPSRYDQYVME